VPIKKDNSSGDKLRSVSGFWTELLDFSDKYHLVNLCFSGLLLIVPIQEQQYLDEQ
jgi:hypothetical protein